MAGKRYSKCVLLGAEKRGIALDDMACITGLSERPIRSVLQENAHLTDRQLAAIEGAASRTAGQLALAGAGITDKGLTAVIEAWAQVQNDAKSAAAPAKHA